MHSWCHRPHTLIKHMLDVVHPPNLGQDPSQSWKLLIRHTDLGFTIDQSWGSDDSWGHHGCRSSSPTSHDPGLHLLEVPHGFANVRGQFPWGISSLPLQDILLSHKSQHQGPREHVSPTYMVMLPDGMPAHSVNTHCQVFLGFDQNSLGDIGFRLWLQLMHCTYLLTLSKYFKWGQTFRLQVKSKTSLHRGECRG